MKHTHVYVVPHCHWDAEWYFTCEDSHILLVENLDYLLDLLEQREDFPSYTFDGLAIVLEEYLRVRPENTGRLAALIGQRRLLVGPWYTQCDSLLIRTESLIRNLQYGIRTAERFGHSMDIGYLPDIFGQHAWLPAIFTDLGIHYCVLQRGVYTEQLQGDLNFWWQSPNGKRIATHYLYYGYGPGKFLATDDTYLNQRLLPILTSLRAMNRGTDTLLLPAGGDQVLANARFPQIVEELNALGLPWHFTLTDYEHYMRDVWADAPFNHTLEGELYACQKSRIHRTCHSTRYDIKRQNWQTEHLLLDQLEPLAAMASLMGIHYPAPLLDEMWKTLFAAHAHNGIEATNADAVNLNIRQRLVSVERSALSLLNLLKKKIARRVEQENALVVFNGDPTPQEKLVRAVLFTRQPSFALRRAGALLDSTLLSQQQMPGGQRVVVTATGERLEPLEDYYRSEVLFRTTLPGLGWHTLSVDEQCAAPALRPAPQPVIENGCYRVTFEQEGLTLENLRNGCRLRHPITFVECGDDGDEFDFAPLESEIPDACQRFSLIRCETGPLAARMTLATTLQLPADMASRKAGQRNLAMVVHTTLELRQGEPWLRVQHQLTNAATDHRLRVHLATPVRSPRFSFADQGYSLLRRDTHSPWLANWREKGFVEKPMPIFTLENIVLVLNDDHNFGVLTQGIKEYEVLPDEQVLALTLYRSVGLLGKDDTAWRPGRASGINNKVVETPDAQLLQPLVFDYALLLDTLPDEAAAFAAIRDYREPVMSYHVQDLNTFEERLERFTLPLPAQAMPADLSLFSLTNPRIFLSMCRPGVEAGELVIRLFNPGRRPERATLEMARPCQMLRLSLREDDPQPLANEALIPPGDYLTLLLRFAP